MVEHSVFIAECLCGLPLESSARDCVCPNCHRHIVFDWGFDPAPEREAERERPDEKSSASEVA
jgi:hypothetical protein